MAVVENRATEDGDVLVIKTDVPIVGIVSLTAFVDSTTGETGSTYFQKQFRYSTNGGLTYFDWVELTTLNIQGIVVERKDYFIVEYKYRRVGIDPVDIEFNNVEVSGDFSELDYPIYRSMIFNDFFPPNSVEILDWAINVLEKLYKRGIIPDYVDRDEGSDDSDYVSFWFSITHFFAILVYYARQFENISTNTFLMKEFAEGRGIYMRSNPDVEELYFIYNNYISEIEKRGTIEIYRRSDEIDGELLRLLDNLITDEFLFAFTTRGELGWCIGRSSPLYTGADSIVNLIKGYEFTEDVEDLDKYPLINDLYISLVDGRINITGIPDDEIAGIGSSTSTEAGGGGTAYYYYGDAIGAELIYPLALSEYAIVIDPLLDYEISFKVERSEYLGDLSFGVSLFDINDNLVLSTRITNGVEDDRFFTTELINKINTEYWIRGVLYAYDASLIPNDVLTIGFGQNLRSVSNAVYLIPVILVENNTGSPLVDVVKIRDIKIRPSNLWFSRGLLSARNFIIGFLKNRSTDYSDIQVENIIDQELIPYNTFTKLKFL